MMTKINAQNVEGIKKPISSNKGRHSKIKKAPRLYESWGLKKQRFHHNQGDARLIPAFLDVNHAIRIP